MNRRKVFKIDQPIRDHLEITINAIHDFSDNAAIAVKFKNWNMPKAIHEFYRFTEKLAGAASAQNLKIKCRIEATDTWAEIKISNDVLKPITLWESLVLPVCGLKPGDFTSAMSLVVPARDGSSEDP